MEIKKADNKTLIMYTSLIFIAAILMIVISFFAQRHLEKLNVNETAQENVTLSNKSAQVSEENMQLVELNKALKDANAKITEANDALLIENEQFKGEIKSYNLLIDVYDKLLAGKKSAARKLLKDIYTENLSAEQKKIYDFLAHQTE